MTRWARPEDSCDFGFWFGWRPPVDWPRERRPLMPQIHQAMRTMYDMRLTGRPTASQGTPRAATGGIVQRDRGIPASLGRFPQCAPHSICRERACNHTTPRIGRTCWDSANRKAASANLHCAVSQLRPLVQFRSWKGGKAAAPQVHPGTALYQ
jgi:hypothetical protein